MTYKGRFWNLNRGRNFLEFVDILLNVSFTTSETERGYY